MPSLRTNALLQVICPAFFLLALAFGVTGCTSPVAFAPRSNLSRESAVIMAQQTAEAAGGRVFMIAPTGSMKPTLDENSVVTVEIVSFGQLRTGDIVIYRNADGFPVVHRLYEKSNGCWYALGDNNTKVDREAVTETNLLGRVCAIFYTSADPLNAAQAALAQR